MSFVFSFGRCGTCIGRPFRLSISSKIWMDIGKIELLKPFVKKYFVRSLYLEGRLMGLYDLKHG